MRILHVNKFFDLHGGAEVYLHQLMDAQRAQGHEAFVFSTRSASNLPSPEERYFVTRFALDRSSGLKDGARKAINYLWNREAQQAFTRLLREVKPDVVHLHNIYNHLSTSILVPIRRLKIPCVQTLHDYKVVGCASHNLFTEGAACERCRGGAYANVIRHRCTWPELAPNLLAYLEMRMVKGRKIYEKSVDAFICPSRFMKERMEDWGMPRDQLRVLVNPVQHMPTAERGGAYLLYAGRLAQEKGLMTLLEAILAMPELPLKIAGRGPEEERLRSFVRAQGAQHVEFLGFQSPAALAQIRARAEAVVLPSIWYDNAPLALLEAMAMGVPCLASRIGGIPEIVEDGVHGFLATPHDVHDWRRILHRFQATSSAVRDDMAKAARAKAQNCYHWEKHLTGLEQIYAEACERLKQHV